MLGNACSHVRVGRFVAPQPLVQEEGLWDASLESTVTCPQVITTFIIIAMCKIFVQVKGL